MLSIAMLICMQRGTSPQIQKPKVFAPVVSSRTQYKTPMSRHKTGREVWNRAQATVYTVAENGRSTANNERCFANGPEYLCAMPTNLNPQARYCQHNKNVCRPIYVATKFGEVITVHVIDHCPHANVIDFNPAAANKIFLNKDSSKQDWFSRSKIGWYR